MVGDGIRVLAANEPVAYREVVAAALGHLRPRVEVLRLLADGATSKEIAFTLGLKPKTVETHRARILDKLGVANSAAAVRAGAARGLLPVPAPSYPFPNA